MQKLLRCQSCSRGDPRLGEPGSRGSTTASRSRRPSSHPSFPSPPALVSRAHLGYSEARAANGREVAMKTSVLAVVPCLRWPSTSWFELGDPRRTRGVGLGSMHARPGLVRDPATTLSVRGLPPAIRDRVRALTLGADPDTAAGDGPGARPHAPAVAFRSGPGSRRFWPTVQTLRPRPLKPIRITAVVLTSALDPAARGEFRPRRLGDADGRRPPSKAEPRLQGRAGQRVTST